MIIFRPVQKNIITQGYGVKGTQPQLIPLYNSIGLLAHNGFDFLAYRGDPIYFNCDCDGEVVAIHNDDPNGEGIGVEIRTNDKDGIFQHRYWHLQSVYCKLGKIGGGDLIGYSDNTGKYTTGDHLHYDVKELFIENGVYKNKNQDNGYFGCIDINLYYNTRFILDYKRELEFQVSILGKLIALWKNLLQK